MTLFALLAATFTFTATATGVEKGTAVEFVFAGANTDRAYESMFLLDEPLDAFCRRIESVVPRGTPVKAGLCRLWPTGCRVRFEPSLDRFVASDLAEGVTAPTPVFTGGTRRSDGTLEASDSMPASFFSTYSLPQSPIVYDTPVDQGAAYGKFTAARKLEKGEKVSFRMIVDETSLPPHLDLVAKRGEIPLLLKKLQSAASDVGDIEATVSFSDELTVDEARATAQALSVIDSIHVKINGSRGLFYRAFLPLEQWSERQERLQQPFELTLKSDGTDELLHIDEDWSVEGNDPKLTPRSISYAEAGRYPKTDTCFIYVSGTQTLDRVSHAMKGLSTAPIVNWYIFKRD